jgi:hypothetical protein
VDSSSSAPIVRVYDGYQRSTSYRRMISPKRKDSGRQKYSACYICRLLQEATRTFSAPEVFPWSKSTAAVISLVHTASSLEKTKKQQHILKGSQLCEQLRKFETSRSCIFRGRRLSRVPQSLRSISPTASLTHAPSNFNQRYNTK